MSKISPIAKTLVGKTNFSSARLAEEKGMEYMSARLKDGSCAKIFGNNEEIDVLIMKNGKVLKGNGYVIPKGPDVEVSEFNIFSKIRESFIDKVEDTKTFVSDLKKLYFNR